MRGALAGVLIAAAVAAPARAAEVDVIVQVAGGTSIREARSAARAAGLVPGHTLRSVRAFHVTGTAAGLRALRRTRAISRVEANAPVRYFTDTSHEATRGAQVLAAGYDGKGIGLGVVDSGVEATHPDLAGRVPTNVRVVAGTAAPVHPLASDAVGGHGTHVAGIAAGSGAASGGRFHGAAPAATIHAFAMGGGPNLINPAWAWDWILQHNDELDPPIRVLNNSFGLLNAVESGGYDPEYSQYKLIDQLVASGVTMVFAAGNAGGDGSERRTSDYCLDPTPGVICVANYDDGGSGKLDGTVVPESSRGLRGRQDTYPDLMAPGAAITSTCRPFLPLCHPDMSAQYPLEYANGTGSSMSAPHVAGIVAQLLQADPSLTPARVEALLVATARPVQTGAPYEPERQRPGMTSLDKGHGLVDAKAALDQLLAKPSPALPAPVPATAEPLVTPDSGRPAMTVRRRGARLLVRIPVRARVRVLRGRKVVARGTVRDGRLVLRVPRRGRLRVEARFEDQVLRASA